MACLPVRVLAILEAYSVTGPAKAVLEFAREAGRGASGEPRIEVSILTFLRGQAENGFTRAVEAEGLPLDTVVERGGFDFGVIRQLREAVNRRRPHVLWTNSVKSHFLVRLSGLHRQAHWIAFHHGYTTTDWKTRLYNQLDRWSLRSAERLITVCNRFAAGLVARGVRRERIRVQHMPIRPAGEVPQHVVAALGRRLGLDAGTRVVLSVGRLSKEKGHAELLRAVAELRRTNPSLPLLLLVVGDGPELGRLEALCRGLDLTGRVRFAGHQEQVRPYYALADVFVLPSHSEGSPNVLLEAMEVGVPVVATAVGGVPEIVAGERDALLVKRNDVRGLADAIRRILLDAQLGARLAHSAREVLSRHTPESYFRSIASIFREVAAP
jgi:glycosyltransferase involved in cell wall biosynthesis